MRKHVLIFFMAVLLILTAACSDNEPERNTEKSGSGGCVPGFGKGKAECFPVYRHGFSPIKLSIFPLKSGAGLKASGLKKGDTV